MSEATPIDMDDLSLILSELAVAEPAETPVAVAAAEAAADVEAATATAETHAAEVKPFTLGQDSFRPTERLTGLERMGEKLARTLKPAIETFARTRLTVTGLPIEIAGFGAWADALPPFVSLSHYRLRPLKNGGMLLAVEADFVAGLVETFYGGSGLVRPHRGGDFTTSEEMLLGRLLERLSGLLVEHWCEVTPVEAQLAQRETSAQHVGFMRDEDQVVLQRFEVSLGAQRTVVTVAYPLAMLRPIEERMATKVHADVDGGDGTWKQRLAQALTQVNLPVRSVLARPEMSVAGLLALKPGDVIPITIPQRTPLLAGTRRIAEGMIGEQEGRAALMIEKVGPEA